MYTENQRELNFTTLHACYVEPMYGLLEAAQNMPASRRRAQNLAHAVLIESICWAWMGSLVGYFRPEHPRLLADGIAQRAEGIEAFSHNWGYLFDREWLLYIDSLMRPRGGAPPFAFLDDMGRESAAAIFASCLASAYQVARSGAANAAIAILNFDQIDDVKEYLKPRLEIEDLANSLADEAGINAASGDIALGTLYAGFGEMIAAIDGFRAASARLTAKYAERWPESGAFLSKVAHLIRWRYVFVENRSELFNLFVDRYLSAITVTEVELRTRFIGYLADLAKDWAGVQEMRPKRKGRPATA